MKYNFKKDFQYYKIYKPYDVLCQFTSENPNQSCLKDILNVDRDIYPVGRLDKDSEGLLILTNDPKLNQWLLNPKSNKSKIYWAQLDGSITNDAINKLKQGVEIRIKGKIFFVKAKQVYQLESEPNLPKRNPPIRFRKNIPTSWCSIEINEGKNRQVRRMFAAVEFPVLRLVRVQIDTIKLENMRPRELRKIY